MTEAWLDGDARAQLDTPALLVDVDRLDANIARMATAMPVPSRVGAPTPVST